MTLAAAMLHRAKATSIDKIDNNRITDRFCHFLLMGNSIERKCTCAALQQAPVAEFVGCTWVHATALTIIRNLKFSADWPLLEFRHTLRSGDPHNHRF
jgi:hypothetical protein